MEIVGNAQEQDGYLAHNIVTLHIGRGYNCMTQCSTQAPHLAVHLAPGVDSASLSSDHHRSMQGHPGQR